MPRIEIINFGSIPPRTKVSLADFTVLANEDMIIDASTLSKQYECMDCDFSTREVDKMADHQDNQSKYHSILQRIKRWWRVG